MVEAINFRVVETFTRSDVFSFSCRLRFSSFFDSGGGGREGRLIFFKKLKVSHGIKIFPVTSVSCQGVRNFSGSGRGGGGRGR